MSPFRLIHRLAQGVAWLCCVALIASCGGAGEVGSGGTGAAPASAAGTVTGFGSIIVDGASFDDSNATVQVEDTPDLPAASEAKLGQRVEVEFDTDGVAKTVNIQAEVVGVVSANGNGTLTVLGQSVVINSNLANGPVTQFAAPYAGLGDVAVADVVEVHGVPRLDSTGYVIQATRIEKRAALPDYLRVAGIVTALSSAAGSQQFTLGGLKVNSTAALILPVSRSLAEGQSVVVWARAANLQTSGVGAPSLTANVVRIRERIHGAQQSYLGGVVAGLGASTFNLGGVVVNYAGAQVTSSGNTASLANGQYVQVRGDFAADGSLVASRVKIRNGLLDAELKGTLTRYNATIPSFEVRGVNVTAAGATLDSCVGGLAEGLYVEVKGRLSLDGIVAQSIKCSAEPAGAVIERRGVASSVVQLTNRFTLTTTAGAQAVRWSALTFFRDGLTSTSLDGAALRVEGVLNPSTGFLIATKIRLDN